jgi:hypothetical protein
MSHRAKRLKMAPLSSAVTAEAQIQYRAQRNDLGEAFGTRKAKSQIKAQERGKVNAAAMEGVKDHLMDSIVVNEDVEGESLNLKEKRADGRCQWSKRLHSCAQHDD